MEILLIYAFIAVTTAFTALYELLMPVIRRRSETHKVDNVLLVYVVFFFVSLIITPAVFLSCVIPSTGERFRNSLYEGLFPEDEKI